jgi:hypothetical protein
MNNFLAVDNGKIRGANDVAFADKVIETKKNKGPWETIDLLVNEWARTSPDDFGAFKVQMDDYRSGLFDRKFGQTTGGKDMERRFTMVFPEKLFHMIRAIYKADELPMNKPFYREFCNRYPLFRVPEKT